MSLYFALETVENNKNKESLKFRGDMLIFCDFIQVLVFTTNHHLSQSVIYVCNNLEYFYYSCRSVCSAGCVDNNDFKVPNCHQNGTCKDGCVTHFWGPTCVICNGYCVGDKSKNEEICRESDGFCVQGCRAGKFSITCSDDCPENCRDSMCNQTNGACLNKCNKGFYGEYCNNTCSLNCLGQGDICFSENGTCIARECVVSWYGPRCEDRCSGNCMYEVCDRNSGFCSDGCVAGYFGNTCKTSKFVKNDFQQECLKFKRILPRISL